MSAEEIAAIVPCVGCGYCCRTAMCAVGARIFGNTPGLCPALKYAEGRYWCDLCNEKSLVANRYRRELYIGEGCCSQLNSDRQSIPPPAAFEVPKEHIEGQCRTLLRAMAHQWLTGDQLWLILNEAAQTLGKPWMAEACRSIREERSSTTEAFMG